MGFHKPSAHGAPLKSHFAGLHPSREKLGTVYGSVLPNGKVVGLEEGFRGGSHFAEGSGILIFRGASTDVGNDLQIIGNGDKAAATAIGG